MTTQQYVRCPSCTAILEVQEDGSTREMQWWELLDWSKMKNTFDRLPPEIRGAIGSMQHRKEWEK